MIGPTEVRNFGTENIRKSKIWAEISVLSELLVDLGEKVENLG